MYNSMRALGLLLLLAISACDSRSQASPVTEASASLKAKRPLELKAEGKADCKNALIDDLEDLDPNLRAADGRDGFWYTYRDTLGTSLSPEGTFAAVAGGASESKRAARIAGTTAAKGVVFAGMGFHFTRSQLPYDLSGATGVCFSAKGSGSAMRVQFPDVNTSPEGGRCQKCYNNFGRDFQPTDEWQEYCFTFAQLAQKAGWGEPVAAFESGRVFGMQWQVLGHGVEYALWVDDVRLSCDSGSPGSPADGTP